MIVGIMTIFSSARTFQAECANSYPQQTEEFIKWLVANRDPKTFLPYSHVGDDRFRHWTITYDAAVTSMAYLSIGRIEESKRIVDFYASTPEVWRLGGIIEAFVAADPPQGQDWSVRMVLGITTTTTNPVNSVVADVFRLTPLHRSR